MRLARAIGARPSELLMGDAGVAMADMLVMAKASEWRRQRMESQFEQLAFEKKLGIETLLLTIIDLLQDQ